MVKVEEMIRYIRGKRERGAYAIAAQRYSAGRCPRDVNYDSLATRLKMLLLILATVISRASMHDNHRLLPRLPHPWAGEHDASDRCSPASSNTASDPMKGDANCNVMDTLRMFGSDQMDRRGRVEVRENSEALCPAIER